MGEPWSEYVIRSAAEVKRTFALLLRETDFLAEADQFEFLRDKKAKGENILEALWFVAGANIRDRQAIDRRHAPWRLLNRHHLCG